jgi:hypothetical protein
MASREQEAPGEEPSETVKRPAFHQGRHGFLSEARQRQFAWPHAHDWSRGNGCVRPVDPLALLRHPWRHRNNPWTLSHDRHRRPDVMKAARLRQQRPDREPPGVSRSLPKHWKTVRTDLPAV